MMECARQAAYEDSCDREPKGRCGKDHHISEFVCLSGSKRAARAAH